jgi:hypothetical protein
VAPELQPLRGRNSDKNIELVFNGNQHKPGFSRQKRGRESVKIEKLRRMSALEDQM